MRDLLARLPADFMVRLLVGMALDFEMAALALGMGLLLGAPLGFVWAMRSRVRVVPNVTVQLLRAAPTFVVMFFLLNVLPHEMRLLGRKVQITRELTVALSLVPYSASYVAEAGAEALRQWRLGSALAALLFLPNVARAYFVLVMSSGSAAAIGVSEGIAVLLREADRLPALSDRLWLFALGVLVYGTILQTGFLAVMGVRSRLARLALSRDAMTRREGSDRQHV
jgi:hypothetical protein